MNVQEIIDKLVQFNAEDEVILNGDEIYVLVPIAHGESIINPMSDD